MTGVLAAVALALSPHPCLAAQRRGPVVPAPIVLHTSCGWYEHDTDGRTFRLPNHWGAIHGTGTGRRYGAQLDVCCDRTRHISLRLHGRLVWRSRRAYPNYGGEIAFGPHEFAFADYYRGVFLTDLRSPERLVVRGEGLSPYDFTRRGDLIVTAGRVLVLVSPAGRVLARYSFRIHAGFVFDWRSDTLFFVSPGGRLAAVRDRRLRLFGRAPTLGGFMTPAPGLLVFTGTRRLVVTRLDGTTVASASWTTRLRLDSTLGVSPDGRRFVFELLSSKPGARWGSSVLYSLHPGSSKARMLLRRWRSPIGCFEGERCAGETGFDWSGRFFMYAPGDGHVGVVDSTTGRLTDLTRLDRSLSHLGLRPEEAQIAWKADFPR